MVALLEPGPDDESADRDRSEEGDGGRPARDPSPVHGSARDGDRAKLVGEALGLGRRGLLPARAVVRIDDGARGRDERAGRADRERVGEVTCSRSLRPGVVNRQ